MNVSIKRLTVAACLMICGCPVGVSLDDTAGAGASNPGDVAPEPLPSPGGLPTSLSLAPSELDVELWPGGEIPYRFDDGSLGPAAISEADQDRIEERMAEWEAATRSLHIGWDSILDFYPCEPSCSGDYLTIRYNRSDESGMGSSIGMSPDGSDGYIRMRVAQNMTSGSDSTLLHELGHAIGLVHEHERFDRDRWLDEGWFDYDYNKEGGPDGTADADELPLLGGYDYDSIMHYASYDGSTLRHLDLLGNAFSRWQAPEVSSLDASRVLQYYARDHQPAWGFFQSLSPSPAGEDDQPDPWLAPGVEAAGTPAVAHQSEGDFDVFVRGSDDGMYWRAVRGWVADDWVSLGCCAGSDPAAISRRDGRIDLLFIGATSGKLIRTIYRDGGWEGWYYLADGYPAGGILADDGGYMGPAVASRQSESLDVFVVRADGRLAVVSSDAQGWGEWETLGDDYEVTARPAAVALSSDEVQLAINTPGLLAWGLLYEPSVVFSGSAPTTFSLGSGTAWTTDGAAPGLARREPGAYESPYRVLAVNVHGRVSHRFSGWSSWRDIGGIPKPGTGISAVQSGSYSADIVMNGPDAVGCDTQCLSSAPNPGGQSIQPGGIWWRHFE